MHPFQCHHRPLLVVLSYTISVLGAYCALQWAAQIGKTRGRALAGWLAGAALAMGGGAIWSMHFIAMLACTLPVRVSYDLATTLASLLVAVFVTGAGLYVVSRGERTFRRLAFAGTFAGLGVAAMHYTGMAAMRMPARIRYAPSLVALSVVIAIVAATAAFWIAFNMGGGWQRLASALVMGIAVCGMHYTGMAAASFVPDAASGHGARAALGTDELAFFVFGVTLVVLLLLSVGGRSIERRLTAEDLRRSHGELERLVAQRTAELARANDGLRTEMEERARDFADRTAHAAFVADVGAAVTRAEMLQPALQAAVEAMVRHLGASIASIWIWNRRELALERRATAGTATDLAESAERISLGQFRVGRIAESGTARISHFAAEPPEDGDKDWAEKRGMTSFAGCPLVADGKTIGVMAMFAAQPIAEPVLRTMATVGDAIALAVERDRAARALRDSEARTRSVIDGMLEGLIIVDAASRIRLVNPAAERLFGYEHDELLGEALARLVPLGDGAPPEEFLRAARHRAMGRITQWEGRRKDGSLFPFELALFEFWTSEGRHFAGSIRDLSERREVERLKREFVSTVSHELRTPLTSIRGSLGLVVGGATGPIPPEAQSLLAIALKNSERLSILVNDILDMEKIESGQLEFRSQEVVLGALLDGTLDAARGFAQQYGVALTIENYAPDARVHADPDRLAQVVTNLVSNAVKFSPSGGTVRVVVLRPGNNARVEIVDRGPGIPEEFRSRIFGRFQQADSSDSRQKGGTGLGLAISRLIVERLGGKIGFTTALGRGTTFWFELPEYGGALEEASPPAGAVPAGDGRPRVLHIDDDPDLPRIVAAALGPTAAVDVARGVREARLRLSGTAYDLVVLDLGLPDGSGLELLPDFARTSGKSTPFLLFTASEVSRDAAESALAVLVKSRSSVEELVRSVRSFVDGAGFNPDETHPGIR